MALTDKLVAIADAIREKTGKEVIVRKCTTAWAEIDSGFANSVSYRFVVDTKKDEFALFSSHLLTR